ncbi:glycosyltransferase family 4 protein [Mucilaginibacter robiniae]|uniref:Glycosyltransferase family 4 protein n=1 Tax=Mucilaginibacter robiniae TaxID=2728022 RepID=A0A7L5DTP1_9SPHI|nr:glycosyltransferase family 4 protein [Mucilaginibacter robiniae]QJD94412.1 glycosyltransferase family 4 protein [Mucilaginibacter robiniae]
MYAGAKALLATNSNIQLAVASLYSGEELQVLKLGEITYYLLPGAGDVISYNAKLEAYWKQIDQDFAPDVTHVHGTEYPHGLAYVNACGSEKVIISIQGLVSVYERYYYGGISEKVLLKNITIRDILRNDTIITQRNRMVQRGSFEKQMIQSVKHIIGRTAWDKAHTWALNSAIKYHFCNETLREEFYKYKWGYQNCKKYSIFLSQAHYPIKGLQQMLAALPFILAHYPQTKVYVAGHNFTNKGFLKINGFGKYIQSQIEDLGIQDNVVFLGMLSEQQMCQQFLKANVFVCPSSIENSPNSIGEAQLLGVPCVASIVGGMTDMIEDHQSGLLYRFEEVEMLAKNVCDIFSDLELTQKLSENGRIAAWERHNKTANSTRMVEIYNNVAKVDTSYMQVSNQV